MEKVTIIIPVKNEEGGLKILHEDFLKSPIKHRYDIDFIFVIHADTDDLSKTVATSFGGRIIEQTETSGKGAAIKQATQLWKRNPTSKVVFLDADASYSFLSVMKILETLDDETDVVSGSRFMANKENLDGMSKMNFIGNVILSSISSFKNGKKITDLCTGLWGFRGSAMNKINLKSKGFDIESEIFGLCRKNRLRHCEIGVEWKQRATGVSKLRSIRDGFLILTRILRT
jgi:glycosyltransferase involved in cell wall biosynthesis